MIETRHRHFGTKAKFRQYRVHPETGQRCLIWASDGPTHSEDIALGEVVKGSAAELDIVRSQLWTPNALADEGEQDILDVYFNDQAVRSSLFGRLYDDTPVETDTLATLAGEVSGTGYGGVTFTRDTDWTQPGLDSGDMMTSSTTKTYTAGGTWTQATQFVLATVVSGTSGLHIGWVALAATRLLVINDTLDVSITVKLA